MGLDHTNGFQNGSADDPKMDVQIENDENISRIKYTRSVTKIMKHERDICRTNQSSNRSEGVADKSLADVIAERKIVAPASRWDKDNKEINNRIKKFKSDSMDTCDSQSTFTISRSGSSSGLEASTMSLDDYIQKKSMKDKKDEDTKAKIDKSLDEIIGASNKSGGGENCEEKKEGRGRKRKLEDEENDYVMNPLEVIERLTSNDGFIIEQETVKQTDHGLGRSHNWKAVAKCGEVSVTIEATFKELARQAAAFELLTIMKRLDPERIYPKCCIPEGCFYDFVVLDKLEETTQELGLEIPSFETIQIQKNGRDFFVTTYYIGDDEFQGHSSFEDHSKIFAAKAAYETYSQKKFPKEKYHKSDEDVTTGALLFHESSAVHSMTIPLAAPDIAADIDEEEELEEPM